MSFSVPSGEGINMARDQQRLRDALLKESISDSLLTFTSEGPDIVAISKSEFWQVECKGVGTGKDQFSPGAELRLEGLDPQVEGSGGQLVFDDVFGILPDSFHIPPWLGAACEGNSNLDRNPGQRD